MVFLIPKLSPCICYVLACKCVEVILYLNAGWQRDNSSKMWSVHVQKKRHSSKKVFWSKEGSCKIIANCCFKENIADRNPKKNKGPGYCGQYFLVTVLIPWSSLHTIRLFKGTSGHNQKKHKAPNTILWHRFSCSFPWSVHIVYGAFAQPWWKVVSNVGYTKVLCPLVSLERRAYLNILRAKAKKYYTCQRIKWCCP